MAAAKKRQRNQKGGVSIGSRSGMIRLRWTHEGKDYDRSPGLKDIPLNHHRARDIAAQIGKDIALGQFDRTCDKYFPKHQTAPPSRQLSTKDLWERWMIKQEEDGVTAQTIVNRYQSLFSLLSQFQCDILSPDDAREFMALLHSRQSPNTSNRYLKMLKTFCNWCIEQGWSTENPFLSIKPVKDSGPKSRTRAPFTLTEIQTILTTFKNHPRHHAYHDFALTLFTLGLRPSEAIGLRWKHIDFTAHTITIAESLSRSGEGVKRVQKGRKNGVTTVLNLPDSLYAVLQGRFTPQTKLDDLIFTSVTGKPIDDHSFSQRTWKDVLTIAGIPYRPPYNCRHSMASHAINQGATLPEVAYLMGHRDTNMVSRVYGHIINRPHLPKMDI